MEIGVISDIFDENEKMYGVLTGDVINSREIQSSDWLPVLKATLNYYGKEGRDWEVYRGDSFQLILTSDIALKAALHIKSAIKRFKRLDVRIAIGIGEVDYRDEKVTQSNGSAFTRSGDQFEELKKYNLQINMGKKNIDETLNLMFDLAMLTFNNWSTTVASVIQYSLENPNKNQLEIAQALGKSQSSISEALNRGAYEEIVKLNRYYKNQMH